jgi:hypothetical protein
MGGKRRERHWQNTTTSANEYQRVIRAEEETARRGVNGAQSTAERFSKAMVLVVESGNGDIIERMWRLVVSARRNQDAPEIWRLTDDILDSVSAFYRLGRGGGDVAPAETMGRFLDIPVDLTTTMPHLLCRPNVVYHL